MPESFEQLTAHLENDPAKDQNKRLPPLHYPGIYPYVRMYQARDGSWWREDVTPKNESYSRGHISGSFTEFTPLGGDKSLTSGHTHQYTTKGSTHTTDLNIHAKIGGSTVDHVSNDHFSEHYSDSMRAVGRNNIKAVGGTHFHHATGANEITSNGDSRMDHNDGNHHWNVAGDHVQYTGNSKYDYIGEEKGVYLPKGNMDTKLDKGKYQLTTGDLINIIASKDITIKSDTKITLKVGSSTIVIEPSKITITSTEVDFNKA